MDNVRHQSLKERRFMDQVTRDAAQRCYNNLKTLTEKVNPANAKS